MGSSTIEGKRIYGRCYAYGSMGPTIIPRAVFFKNRDRLEEAEVTSSWIQKQTGNICPTVSFKTTELGKLDLNLTIEVAAALGINYIKSAKVTTKEKVALRQAIVKTIEGLQGV